jgi:hypothetical protein
MKNKDIGNRFIQGVLLNLLVVIGRTRRWVLRLKFFAILIAQDMLKNKTVYSRINKGNKNNSIFIF